MGPKDVIRKRSTLSDYIIKSYVKDLSDADLRLRPVEGMHPIALQLGHLIAAERMFKEMIKPGSSPRRCPRASPKRTTSRRPGKDDSRFTTKDEYLKLWDEQRAATKALLDGVSDADLDDNRGGKLPPWAPTVGAVLNMAGLHAHQPFRPVRGGPPAAQEADRVLNVAS